MKDASFTKDLPTLTSATASFTTADVGSRLAGPGIPIGTRIQAYTNASSVTMSNPATETATNAKVTIGGARSFSTL